MKNLFKRERITRNERQAIITARNQDPQGHTKTIPVAEYLRLLSDAESNYGCELCRPTHIHAGIGENPACENPHQNVEFRFF